MALCKRSLNYCCNMVTDGCFCLFFVDSSPGFSQADALGKESIQRKACVLLCCRV